LWNQLFKHVSRNVYFFFSAFEGLDTNETHKFAELAFIVSPHISFQRFGAVALWDSLSFMTDRKKNVQDYMQREIITKHDFVQILTYLDDVQLDDLTNLFDFQQRPCLFERCFLPSLKGR